MALIACKDCQKEFSTDAKCCPNCGATKSKIKSIICKKCKKEYLSNSYRCPHCGKSQPLSAGIIVTLILIGISVLKEICDPQGIDGNSSKSAIVNSGPDLTGLVAVIHFKCANLPNEIEINYRQAGHAVTESHARDDASGTCSEAFSDAYNIKLDFY